MGGAPPRDDDGRVRPHDDPAIPDEAFVVRYIASGQFVPDRAAGAGRRLSKGAFSASSKDRDPYQGMSADLLQPMIADGLPPTGQRKPIHEAVVRLQVGKLRSLGLWVGKDPKEHNPYHVCVWGVTPHLRKKILDLAEWVEKPPDVA